MAVDSVKVINYDHIKRSKPQSGRLYKGQAIVAANASIPTKFQTIVTENCDKKGFLSKAKRFNDDSFMTEVPAPGSYGALSKDDVTNPSFSKKGTGSFASKSKRQLSFALPSGPGPGIYALPSLLSTRKNFNRCKVERLFQLPIAQTVQKSDGVPAPNSYEVLKYSMGKSNNVTANAAFKSKTKRDMLNLSEQKNNPAPGQYDINDQLLHQSAKVPLSSFKSKSKRQLQPKGDEVPGPGAYDPNAPIEQPAKLIFPRKHYLCISAPAMPLPVTPPSPGPGAYELRSFDEAPKHYMSSSAFVSTTGRWAGHGSDPDLPGPAHYRPLQLGKQSFIFNSSRRWI
ncbi:O(6)-methylguanine-induced apoptosis 2-like [Physella acuta]|uniref:O(6)-methylguanine-induced apoptosis 2-like n=1 Tax=Physella acuta TaxID=109671 RepID=UPI0027DE9721|nr:O(6)-methylguanine-induced apoptosis 2-like [Physella acuta]